MNLFASARSWAKRIKRDALTLWFCARHRDTPIAAKILALLLAAYAFSPIDLIPDFIPVLGMLDELIILPLGIALCLKLVPEPVLYQCRQQAAQWLARSQPRPRSYAAAAFILLLWGAAAWACFWLIFR